MNVELLRRVRDHILEDYRRLNMSEWIKKFTPYETKRCPYLIPDCGTVGCIAGWTCILGGDENIPSGVRGAAVRLLDIPIFSEADRLFYMERWPTRYRLEYQSAQPQRRAEIVGEVIDNFIKEYSK